MTDLDELRQLDTTRWRTCAPQLPDGGCEAVRTLCDLADQLASAQAALSEANVPALIRAAREQAARDEAERIAVWLHEQYTPFTSMNGRDRDYLNGVIENIRAGAYRKGQ